MPNSEARRFWASRVWASSATGGLRPKAIKNAIRNAAEMAVAGLPQRLEERLQQTGAARKPRSA